MLHAKGEQIGKNQGINKLKQHTVFLLNIYTQLFL